ncbi:hypothetical protein CPB83DRAFT_781430 [Crepidotus variabilis]|uniref:DNA replication factor Cdt1 C-terminal domain-containing protein n=1 Tax=Crepidotus variabilis TaxID=179855 RepID=A0A9P6ESI8_9AGAR|nr:hypothetical protein CPB83DRAFT_781430 [Crepidotus variabilis]
MSDLYTSLQVSPKKKKRPAEFDDGKTLTPKKLRTAPPTPPPTKSRKTESPSKTSLPTALSRLYNLQTALQHALSHALATCAISPTADSGIVKNVLNHISVVTYSGFSTTFEVEDLKRLCWLWEWDGKYLPKEAQVTDDDEDNPFLESKPSLEPPPSDWTHGSMGLIVSSATHYSKTERKRVPAYGIGIEVEMDIDKDMGSGMAAVARWTAQSEKRRLEFKSKLERWIELHDNVTPLPPIPLIDIPDLAAPKVSALTRTLASCSPSAISPALMPTAPASPSRSPAKKPARNLSAIPFPTLSSNSPIKGGGLLFPQTPRHDRIASLPPQTPSELGSPSKETSDPSTPHRKGADDSPAQTPSTARRQALLERVRQRSLSMSPTKSPSKAAAAALARFGDPSMSRDQVFKLSQEAMRRRCLLGRLGGIADSIWMLFTNSASPGTSTPSRKRRILPLNDVIAPVIKSSPVPISAAEAHESINMLVKLCPFFLKKLELSGLEWLEMPAPSKPNQTNPEASPSKGRTLMEPPSPGRLRASKDDSAQQLLTRSPRRVTKEGGTLREVREIIRRELELDD